MFTKIRHGLFLLHENDAQPSTGCVTFNDKLLGKVRHTEDGGCGESLFERDEGEIRLLRPLEF